MILRTFITHSKMVYKRKQIFSITLASFVLFTSVKGQCSTNSPVIASAENVAVINTTFVVYTCVTGKAWSSGDTAIPSTCVGTDWTPVTATCDVSSATSPNCSSATLEAPAYSQVVSESVNKFKVFQCTSPKHWLSGAPVRITQCRGTEWTKIWDICDEGCPTPRDCEDVADLGLEEDGMYLVIPSGKVDGKIYEVLCRMNDTMENGGNWTYIFKNDVTEAAHTNIEYREGYPLTPSFSNPSYFVGLNFLQDISLPSETRPIPGMIMEIIFKDVDETAIYYAAYGNFTVGQSPGYPILSLGEYHGNAGDGMCPHLNSEFQFNTSTSAQWWGVNNNNQLQMEQMNGNWLTQSNFLWYPLKNSDKSAINSVEIRIRSVQQDNQNLCPPMVGYEPYEQWWRTTNASIPFSRSPGTTITWECLGELFMEGEEGGIRTHEGKAVCQSSIPPVWDKNVTLPCTVKCPDGFNVTEDGNRCFMFSQEETQGFLNASLRCMELNSTLAVMRNSTDVFGTEPEIKYFVNHAQRGYTQTSIVEALPPLNVFNCSNNCLVTSAEECTVVTSESLYEHIDCMTPSRFICEVTPWCPPGYDEINGACYMVITETQNSFLTSLLSCAANGSSLAYPTSTRIDDLANYLIEGYASGTTFYTGISSGITETPQTVLELQTSTHILHTVDIEFIGPTHAVCQYPGVIGCLDPPSPAFPNMTRIWDNATMEAMNITYECEYGFFVNWNTSVVNQTVQCLGMLGGWKANLLQCFRVPVCQNTPPEVNSSLITNTTDANSFYLDGVQTFTCPDGMAFDDLNTTLNVTCKQNDIGLFSFVPDILPLCSVCLDFDHSNFPNSTTTWSNTSIFTVGSTFELTCIEGFEYSFGKANQTVTCSEAGWNYTGILPCYQVCSALPPPPGENVVPINVTENAIGTLLFYECSPSHYFLPSQAYPTPVTSASITCNASSIWESDRADEPLNCTQLCLNPPPTTPAFANSSWEGTTLPGQVDDMASYACHPNYLFGNSSSTWNITCNGTHWVPEVSALFSCRRVCLEEPQEVIVDAIRQNWTSFHGWLDQEVVYQCPNGTANKDERILTSIFCKEYGWTNVSDDFLCEDVCFEAPPSSMFPAINNATNDIREGVTVKYTCEGGFRTANAPVVLYSVCVNHSWTLQVVPECTPLGVYVLDELGPLDQHYSETSDFFESTIQDDMIDISGITDNYVEVDGPYGFGLATGLRAMNEQCLKKTPFSLSSVSCLNNPSTCNTTTGFSISIWERPLIAEVDSLTPINERSEDNPDEYRYILSTGGDTYGHPGVALAHEGDWLIGIVSNGSQFWKASVLGQTRSGSWNNIGIVWNITNGIVIYVNLTAVAHRKYPGSAQPAQGLNPPELMIGCHKDQNNSNYRGFNNADVDEFAVWKKSLYAPEVKKMLGGYTDKYLSPTEASVFISNVSMSDLDQQKAAVAMLQKMSASTTSKSSTASTSELITTAGNPTEEFDDDLFKIMYTIMDPQQIPASLDIDAMESFLGSMRPLDNLLSQRNGPGWLSVQSKTDEAGSMHLVSRFWDYIQEMLRKTDFPNGTEPFCKGIPLSNLINQHCIMTVSDFKNQDRMIVLPDYKNEKFEHINVKWNSPYDRIAFPVGILADELCAERIVSYSGTVYDHVSEFGQVIVNQVQIPRGPRHVLDSRVISAVLNLNEEPEKNPVTTTAPLTINIPTCNLDLSYLKDVPIRIKLEHKSKTFAARTLLFHEDEKVIDVAVRRCVWWNKNLSDFGVWDSSGCRVIKTTDEFTTCTCSKFGTYAILAEMIPEKAVSDEPLWLTIMKYAFYAISAFAVVLYIIVVAASEDLKDQFHLMGLNMAVSILAGSIVLVLTDCDSIRRDRHTCTAFGTMIQFFYGAVGFWMLALGQASFKAITGGIIGGKLQAYMFMCWGAALAMTGVPFLCYLHDLGTDPRCFISWSDDVKLVFFIPQIMCAGVAMFCGIVILCNLSTSALRKENLIDDYGSFCRGAGLLCILLSMTWTFGLLAYVRFGFTETDFYPIFQVLNSLAGVCLFVFIGMGSNRFRMFVIGQAKIRRKMVQAYAFGLPGFKDQSNKAPPKVWSNY